MLLRSPSHAKSLKTRLIAASALGIGALGISYALELPAYGFTVVLLYPAVVGSAYVWGRTAGLACTLVCAVFLILLLHYDETLPSSTAATSVGAVLLFIVTGTTVSVLLSRLERALSELRAAHSAAVSAEREKDLLLREFRHRTKNDLANVSAILQIEARQLDDEAATAVRRAAERIQIIARLHERMERDDHVPVVEAGNFVHELCEDFRTTFLAGSQIQLLIDCCQCRLDAGRAVSLGLIANELITNALKHAFPSGGPGTIWVTLALKDSEGELLVTDDGIGAPEHSGTGSGRRLVLALVRQMDADLERRAVTTGTSWRLRFVGT